LLFGVRANVAITRVTANFKRTWKRCFLRRKKEASGCRFIKKMGIYNYGTLYSKLITITQPYGRLYMVFKGSDTFRALNSIISSGER